MIPLIDRLRSFFVTSRDVTIDPKLVELRAQSEQIRDLSQDNLTRIDELAASVGLQDPDWWRDTRGDS